MIHFWVAPARRSPNWRREKRSERWFYTVALNTAAIQGSWAGQHNIRKRGYRMRNPYPPGRRHDAWKRAYLNEFDDRYSPWR